MSAYHLIKHGVCTGDVDWSDEVHQADQEEDVPPAHAAACSLGLHDAFFPSRRADRDRCVGAIAPSDRLPPLSLRENIPASPSRGLALYVPPSQQQMAEVCAEPSPFRRVAR